MNEIKTNLVRGKYNAISTNYLVSADITKIGSYGQVYIIIDHASRAVIGHAYGNLPFSAEVIEETNKKVQKDRAFLPPFHIWHTDRESIFTNKEYVESMQASGIKISRGSAKAFQNQVIESFNRTFKKALKPKIAALVKQVTEQTISLKGAETFKERKISVQETGELVLQVIEEYNNKSHSTLQGLTPNQMEEALFQEHQNQHPQGLIEGKNEAKDIMITRKGDIEDAYANAYRAQVVAKYKGDWLKFFLDWKKEQEEQSKQVLSAIEQSKDTLVSKLEKKAQEEAQKAQDISKKYESLYDQFLEVQKQTTFLQQAEQQRQEEEQQKRLKKEKKKKATKQRVRQTVTVEELQEIIKHCVKANNAYVKARRVTAIMLLYLTGLRVQNLLNVETKQLLQLLNQGHTEIRLIKGGADKHPIRLAYKGMQLIGTIKKEIVTITQNKRYDQPAFTPRDDEEKAINKDVHEKELNEILIRASEMLKKHLRTHSFRATIITDLLAQGVPIQEVKEIMGHLRIESTLKYNRNKLTLKKIDKLVAERYKKEPE